ncbi:MAG: adenosylmethionine--8-amino-7-oxononanoate transaminase [Planctomycetota bacterium]
MTTEQLREWDSAHVWHPFSPMQAYRAECPPIIAAADGFFLIDTEGKRYLDGVSSLWCNVHGHRVPEIDQAIRDQLDQVGHSTLLGLGNVPSIQLAEQLVRRAPRGLDKVFYSDSGATAVEAAIKIAYQYHRQRKDTPAPRDLFISLGDAYHGDTLGAVSVGGVELFHGVYHRLLFPTLKIPAPVAYRVPAGHTSDSYLAFCNAELERTLVENRDRIAAMVIEPLVQGAAGILVHPAGYLRRVRELTRQLGILLIADEVAVGFGRTGNLFACDDESVAPDLLCLAKGLTGGYLPLAATLATNEIYEAFLGDPWEGRTFFHGHTYTGNPLGAAAALASLKLFESRDVLGNVRNNADILRTRLRELADAPHVGEIRQKGVMCGVELVRDRESKSRYPNTERRGHQITLEARKRGVIVRPLGDVVVLMPAPGIPADLVHQLCDVVIECIRVVTAR